MHVRRGTRWKFIWPMYLAHIIAHHAFSYVTHVSSPLLSTLYVFLFHGEGHYHLHILRWPHKSINFFLCKHRLRLFTHHSSSMAKFLVQQNPSIPTFSLHCSTMTHQWLDLLRVNLSLQTQRLSQGGYMDRGCRYFAIVTGLCGSGRSSSIWKFCV